MSIRTISFLFFISLAFFSSLSSQDNTVKVKERVEKLYHYKNDGQDSMLREHLTLGFDTSGRLISKKLYRYLLQSPGQLLREETAVYNPENKVMTEKIIRYRRNKEPDIKKLEKKYLTYTGKKSVDQYIWRKLYNDYGELDKEDTLTYNDQDQLIKKCIYDYRGNTSLYCYHYKYNRKGLKKRMRRYSKWTTVNIKGGIKNKRSKIKDIRYRYNRDGQLTKEKGKYMSSRFVRKLKYHSNGILAKDEKVIKRKLKNSKSKRKKTGKRYNRFKEIERTTYNTAGKVVEDIKMKTNEDEIKHKIVRNYEADTLLTSEIHYYKGNKVEESQVNYRPDGTLEEKRTKKYHSTGKFRYTIVTEYNKKGKAISEKQIAGKRTLSLVEYSHNEHGFLKEIRFFKNSGTPFERKIYEYRYYTK